MRFILFSISSILLLAVNLTAKEPLRTWTSVDGRTIEARFIDEKKDKVRIRRTDGRVFNIPLDNLSEEDQKYVKSLAVDKLSLNTDPKDEIEETDSNTSGDVVSEYGSKPNYFVKSALDLEMIWVKSGTFKMGSPTTEVGRLAEGAGRGRRETQHKVKLRNGFYLGKYEVTQAQYEAVMTGNTETNRYGNVISATPSYWHGYPNRPVERVSWNDIQVFLTRLNDQEAGNIPKGWAYVLPTEAQWEYACRAGTTTAYSWGDSISASDANWDHGNDANQTEDVGQYSANPWGFFDMHGNVWEWTADAWGGYASGVQTDPFNAGAAGSLRVIRGGGSRSVISRSDWRARSELRSASRYPRYPYEASVGFRIGFQQQ